MRDLLFLILGFILTIQIGSFSTEQVRNHYAEKLEYDGEYRWHLGRLIFTNQSIQSEFNVIMEDYKNDESKYIESSKWKELVRKDREDHSKIELSGKLFTLLISIVGIIVFLSRRINEKEISWKDWVGILLGLFFMREVIISVVVLVSGGIQCNEAKLWHQYNFPVFGSARLISAIGIICLFYIIYKVPQSSRGTFLISGIIGSVIGILLWVFYIGELLL